MVFILLLIAYHLPDPADRYPRTISKYQRKPICRYNFKVMIWTVPSGQRHRFPYQKHNYWTNIKCLTTATKFGFCKTWEQSKTLRRPNFPLCVESRRVIYSGEALLYKMMKQDDIVLILYDTLDVLQIREWVTRK